MGKYMRKGKATGKAAVMEVSQGTLGVKTRAKTLALVEQDRKLALSRCSGSKHPQSSVIDPFHSSSSYLELRSRKLEKVMKEMEKPARGQSSMDVSWNEDRRNSLKVKGVKIADEVVCTTRPEGEEFRMHVEAVGTSRTPELSPRQIDGFQIFKDFEIEPPLSTPRAIVDSVQLRCSGSAGGEEPLKSGNVPPQRRSEAPLAHNALHRGVSPAEDGLSQDGLNYGRPEVEASSEYVAGEQGISSVRRRFFCGSPVSISTKDREAGSGIDPGSSTRMGLVGDRQDRRMANHHRIMNRRYMRTNLFSDAKAIDELFTAPNATERDEGKRFTERYNYDVVNDKPLKGRYEWVAAVETVSNTTPTTQQLSDQQQPTRRK